MLTEFEIPKEIPVMTLPHTVLFPQAMMPLYIFEPRYREMLKDVLEDNRLFIVASQDEEKSQESDLFEPLNSIASVGIVRASHQSEDGTSNLIIQGLVRVRVINIVQEEPYRIAEIEVIKSILSSPKQALINQQKAVTRLFDVHRKLGGLIPKEVLSFLNDLDDPETFLDIAAYTLCADANTKQEMLEILDTHERYALFIDYFRRKNQELALEKKLSKGLDDDQISCN